MKNSIRFFVFVCLVVVLFFGIESVYQIENQHSNWRKFENLPEESIDLVIFGNSHGINTYYQALLDEALSINSLVVGEGGTSFPLVYFELSRILKTQTPDTIVIESYLFDSDIRESRYIYYLRNVRLKFLDFGILFDFFNAENYWWISELAFDHLEYYKTPYVFFRNFDALLSLDKDGVLNSQNLSWYFHLDPVINLKKHHETFDYPRNELDSETIEIYVEYFEKIIKLCDEHNIEILVVRSPMQSVAYEEPLAEIASVMTKYDIPFGNFDALLELSQIDFYNSNHVSTMGSFKTTLAAAEFIAEYTDLSVNQAVIDHYSQLLFDDFHLDRMNGFRLSLVPNIARKDELTFDWLIDYEDGNQFKLITTEPEFYLTNNKIKSVNLTIISEETKYPLTLEFNSKKALPFE